MSIRHAFLAIVLCFFSASNASYRELSLCVVFGAMALRGLQISTTANDNNNSHVQDIGGIVLFLGGVMGILGSRGIIEIWDNNRLH